MGTISESKVIQRLEELLEAIDEPARDRVLAWANARWSKPVPDRVEVVATTDGEPQRTIVRHAVGQLSSALPTVGGMMLGQTQVSRDGVVGHSDGAKEQRR